MKHCKRCGTPLAIVSLNKDGAVYECPRCGKRYLESERRRNKRVGPSEVK
jgi:uncharacterized Zn finger protein (UPF0148 family)